MEFSQLKNKFYDIDAVRASPEAIVVYLKGTRLFKPKKYKICKNGKIWEETALGLIKLMDNADMETMFLFLTKVRELREARNDVREFKEQIF